MSKKDDDNLFEDLDSFFEPIKDVGWPGDTGFEEPAPAPAPPEEEEPPTEQEAPADTTAVMEPIETAAVYEPDEPDEIEPIVGLGGDDDFEAAPEPADEGSVADVSPVVVGIGADENELIRPAAEEEIITISPDAEESVPGEPTLMRFDEEGLIEAEPGLGMLTPGGIEDAADGDPEPLSGFADDRDVEREILGDLAPPDIEEGGIAEGLTGPTWHEPTHVDVGAEEPGADQPRNMPAAFVTGVALGAVAVISLLISPALFAWLAGAGVLFALFEFYAALQKRHAQPATMVGLIFGAFMLYAAYQDGMRGAASALALGFIFCVLWEIATPAKFRKSTTSNIGLTVLGMAYLPLLAGFGMTLLRTPDAKGLMLFILVLTFAYDTVAFFIGMTFGEHQIAPHISPKKSWEGAAAGTVVVLAVAIFFGGVFADLSMGAGVLLGLAVVVGAPLGDLAESLMKRDLGIKDMGNILPGHGGVLDRIDSLLFVLPLAAMVLAGLNLA